MAPPPGRRGRHPGHPPKDYDRAVALLVDLRDLTGRAAEAAALRRRHGHKPSLLKRFDDEGIGN